MAGPELCADVVCDIMCLLGVKDVAAAAGSCKALREASGLRRQATALARHYLRVHLRRIRTSLHHRRELLREVTGRAAPVPRPAAVDAIAHHLGRAPHGLQELLAATQKALTAVETQTLVAPARMARVQQDLSNVGTLACLLAWRAGARERLRQRQQQQQQHAHLAAAVSDGGGGGGNASGGAAAAVSRGVQTEEGLTLGEVMELVAAFRSLADSANASSRLCECSLNLLHHFLLPDGAPEEQEEGAEGEAYEEDGAAAADEQPGGVAAADGAANGGNGPADE